MNFNMNRFLYILIVAILAYFNIGAKLLSTTSNNNSFHSSLERENSDWINIKGTLTTSIHSGSAYILGI
jgi:hypothetical protein